jgi:hypothetical protein
MIQKRFQRYSSNGIVWTDWVNFEKDDSKLSYFIKEEPYQLKPKLKNEYRIV